MDGNTPCDTIQQDVCELPSSEQLALLMAAHQEVLRLKELNQRLIDENKGKLLKYVE